MCAPNLDNNPNTNLDTIFAAAGGDPGFDEIFLTHYEPMVRAICRLVGSPARAEELASDLFLKLHRQRLPLGNNSNVGAWLYRAAVRLGLDELRASARRVREIAEVLRVNPPSVGTLLSRAKRAFEGEYRSRYGEETTL